MSNIHSFSSLNASQNCEKYSGNENNNFYVGGPNNGGGGSGLEIESVPQQNKISDSIYSHGNSNLVDASDQGPIVTMYRNGFIVDNGPFRCLDDPYNEPFLTSLSKGMTPKELEADIQKSQRGRAIKIGLLDRRHETYEEKNRDENTLQNFCGHGTSLGRSTYSSLNNGLINPELFPYTGFSFDENRPFTSIQIRLMNGTRLIKRFNVDNSVSAIVEYIIQATKDKGNMPFVITSGFPPKVLTDFGITIQESKLLGTRVTQRAP